MARLSDNKIQEIIDEYKKIGTYSGVAKKVGVSASTVKKYVESAIEKPQIKNEIPELLSFDEVSTWVENYILPYSKILDPDILKLDEDEKKEISEIIEELKK